MTRKCNKYTKETYIHILLKSTMQLPLFKSKEDYKSFQLFLDTKQKQYQFSYVGYGLFPDHVHIVFEQPLPASISTILHGLLILYTKYYHKKYMTKGSLFAGGYKKNMIRSSRELISTLRYIHQEPKRSGLSSSLSYPYSSFNDYINPYEASSLNRHSLYRLFDHSDPQKASNLFRSIHHDTDNIEVLDIDNDIYQKVARAKEILKEELTKYDINYLTIPKHYSFREQLILKIYYESQLNQQEIADLLSISRHIVGRIIRLNKD